MKSTLVLENAHPGVRHNRCLFGTLEMYLRGGLFLLTEHLQKWEDRFSFLAAAGLRFSAIISADRKLAVLLAGTTICAAILVTLLIALTTCLVR